MLLGSHSIITFATRHAPWLVVFMQDRISGAPTVFSVTRLDVFQLDDSETFFNVRMRKESSSRFRLTSISAWSASVLSSVMLSSSFSDKTWQRSPSWTIVSRFFGLISLTHLSWKRVLKATEFTEFRITTKLIGVRTFSIGKCSLTTSQKFRPVSIVAVWTGIWMRYCRIESNF